MPSQDILQLIEAALASAYERTYGEAARLRLRPDASGHGLRLVQEKQVVATVENPHLQISLANARSRDPRVSLGDMVDLDISLDASTDLRRARRFRWRDLGGEDSSPS